MNIVYIVELLKGGSDEYISSRTGNLSRNNNFNSIFNFNNLRLYKKRIKRCYQCNNRGVIFNLRYYVYIYLVDTNDNAIGGVIF